LAGLAAGAVLVAGEARWFRRRSLVERLEPYAPGGRATVGTGGIQPGRPWQAVIGPWARQVGGRLATLLGVEEDLALRLRRLHAPIDPTTCRLRQLAWSALGFTLGSMVAAATRAPLPMALLFTAGGALLAFLLVEHRLGTASRARQERLARELPVVA